MLTQITLACAADLQPRLPENKARAPNANLGEYACLPSACLPSDNTSAMRGACLPTDFQSAGGSGDLCDKGGDGAHAVGEDHGADQRHEDEEDALLPGQARG
jgi:hypothetical protein